MTKKQILEILRYLKEDVEHRGAWVSEEFLKTIGEDPRHYQRLSGELYIFQPLNKDSSKRRKRHPTP